MNWRRDPSSCPPKVLKHGRTSPCSGLGGPRGREPGHHPVRNCHSILRPAPRDGPGTSRQQGGRQQRMYRARACCAVLQGRRELVTTGPAFEGQPRLLCSLQRKRHRARSNGRADSFTLKQTTPLLSRHISAAAAAAAVRGHSTNSAQQRLIESHPTTHPRARFSFQSLPFLSPG